MVMLLISRFLFGFGGSKVVHRKYIAYYITKKYWTKYYSRLIFMSYLGMSFGPITYLISVYLNVEYALGERSFILPGYFNLYVSTAFLLVLIFFFRKYNKDERA